MTGRFAGSLLVLCLLIGICGVAPVSAAPAQTASSVGIDTNTNSSEAQPFAEAGLDQTVPAGAVVSLDAYGSRAAEGKLVAFEWTIERPDGLTAVPDCLTCEQTQFQPTTSGQYNVTLTVEDDSGRTASDTMYVTVRSQPAPQVTLSGPDELSVNETARVQLDAMATVGKLASVEWYVNETYRRGGFLDAKRVDESITLSPKTDGNLTVTAVVRDDNGTATRVRKRVGVREPEPFEVTIIGGADTVSDGDPWAPVFEVTNTGSRVDTQQIALRVSTASASNPIDRHTVTLRPGDTQQFDDAWGYSPVLGEFDLGAPSLGWDTQVGIDTSSHTAIVKSETDRDTTQVSVGDSSYTVDIISTGTTASSVNFAVEIKNTGEVADSQTIEWRTDEPFASGPVKRNLALDPGESRKLSESLTVPSDVDYDDTDDYVEVQSADDTDRESVSFADTNSPRFSCGLDNCVQPRVDAELQRQATAGEFMTLTPVTIFAQGERWGQESWIIESDRAHPYEKAPSKMEFVPGPGRSRDAASYNISNGHLAGFTPEEPGLYVIGISDDINGLVYYAIETTVQPAGPPGYGGGGSGEDPLI